MKKEKTSWFWTQSFDITKCVLFQEYLRQQQQLVCSLCLSTACTWHASLETTFQPSIASWNFLK